MAKSTNPQNGQVSTNNSQQTANGTSIVSKPPAGVDGSRVITSSPREIKENSQLVIRKK